MSEATLRKPVAVEADPNVLQRRASDPDYSVWVGASAGSGKTTILTKRVMRLLLAGVAPQRILCLTFTRAAAAEMAIRVTQGLSYWAICSDGELRASLDDLQGRAPEEKQLTEARRLFARLLACPGGMRIRTIHAFCQEILRRFPIEAGLPPHFSVIEEDDARALQEEVRAGILRDAARMPDSDIGRALRHLTGTLGEHGFAGIMGDVLSDRTRLQDAVAETGSLAAVIAALHARLGLGPEDSEENLCRAAVDGSVFPEVELREAAQRLGEGSKSFAARGRDLLDWLELPADERAAAFDRYCGFFLTAEGAARAQFANKEMLKKYPGLDDVMRGEAARILAVRERIEAARMAEGTAAILTLGEEWIVRYEARKAAQALLDYDDLVSRASRLLRREGIAPWVLYKLDGGLDHILVDEAQDTSRAQWGIIAALAEEFFAGSSAREGVNRTLFAVGDEKQSIFSFQHADPAAFAAMKELFARRIAEAGKLYRDVPLHISFRSAPAILRAVDAVFADPRARAGVALEPTAHAAHHRGKIGRVEVWPLIAAADEAAADEAWGLPLGYEAARDPEAELAARIAARIADWWAKKEVLPGEGRNIA
ncbi:MAG TPA: UvrD-helicase domain-containing protein, partial [Alphaproteobacteria bacterium]|nr:UvrD-helicase domain-containing protein [Alphaproteobacteria bacterium]